MLKRLGKYGHIYFPYRSNYRVGPVCALSLDAYQGRDLDKELTHYNYERYTEHILKYDDDDDNDIVYTC